MTTQTKVGFMPLGNRVVIEPSEDDEQVSAGGIYIPDTAKEKPQAGTVVAVGPGKLSDDGSTRGAYGSSRWRHGRLLEVRRHGVSRGDVEYLVVREDDILFKK